MLYRVLRHVLGALLDFFYRRTSLGGSLPAEGPLVIVANHPNGLIDPMLVGLAATRPLRFLAKAPIFRMPVLGAVARGVGALPVWRQKDSPGEQSKNEETFSACHDALDQGAAICIFPEGLSHSEPSLQRLRTGAARIALGAEARRAFALGVRIVPVGLTYRTKHRFLGQVATEIGEPVGVADLAEAYGRDPVQAVEALTLRIGEALARVTLNAERWEDVPLLEAAEALWASEKGLTGAAEEREKRLRAFAEGLRRERQRDPQRVDALRQRVAAFHERLAHLGANPSDLDASYTPWKVARFLVRNLAALLLGLPVAAAGVAAFFVPYHAARLAAKALRPELDLEATYKILAIIAFYPLWYLGGIAAAAFLGGPAWAALAALAAPPCGVYAVQFLKRREEALEDVALFFRLGARSARKARLLERRAALAREIDALAG